MLKATAYSCLLSYRMWGREGGRGVRDRGSRHDDDDDDDYDDLQAATCYTCDTSEPTAAAAAQRQQWVLCTEQRWEVHIAQIGYNRKA